MDIKTQVLPFEDKLAIRVEISFNELQNLELDAYDRNRLEQSGDLAEMVTTLITVLRKVNEVIVKPQPIRLAGSSFNGGRSLDRTRE